MTGLVDIYLTANQATNKLFLNKGNFTFEEIYDKAKVENQGPGPQESHVVSYGDGFLDIIMFVIG